MNNKQKILGISLCHYERYASKELSNEKRRENKIFDVLKDLNNDANIKFRFFIINGNTETGDAELTSTIINMLALKQDKYEIIKYNTNTIETINSINECDAMFSTRLHGAIFAASQNIPSLLVEYHQKCTNYLNDIGLSKQWRIGDINIESADVVSKIYLLLEMQLDNFYPKRSKLLELAEKNFLDESILKEMKR